MDDNDTNTQISADARFVAAAIEHGFQALGDALREAVGKAAEAFRSDYCDIASEVSELTQAVKEVNGLDVKSESVFDDRRGPVAGPEILETDEGDPLVIGRIGKSGWAIAPRSVFPKDADEGGGETSDPTLEG